MSDQRVGVAIVGAGPAGAFAADRLLRRRGDVEIDLFERLPTPWGLLRGGVAPDHQEIKRLDETFDRETLGRGCRFFGNVEVGVDISHSELMRHYTAVIYATGAQTDKSLGIPGEDLPGSWAATEFVAWYNGHPDYRELEFDLSASRAVVIGNGNVAADVIRLLTLSPRAGAHGRRRPRARITAGESHRGGARAGPARSGAGGLHELRAARARGARRGRPAGRSRGRRARSAVASWLKEEGTFTARKNVELLRAFADRPERAGRRRRIVLRFLRSPVEIRGTDSVEAIEVQRNEIVRADDGSLRPRPLDEAPETIDCGLVLRSVGYRAVPLPGVPFDERSFILPNDRGRVLSPDGDAAPGRLRGRLDKAGSHRHPGHEQARCRRDRRVPRR